ncbi:hypothetical protein ACS0TY_027336 [Phlomoides rotata]
MNQKTPDCGRPPLSSSVIRISRYPPAKNSGFPRDPQDTIRNSKFGRSSFDKGIEATPVSRESEADKMGKFNFFYQAHTRAMDSATKTLRYVLTPKNKVDSDDEGKVENLPCVEKQGSVENSDQEPHDSGVPMYKRMLSDLCKRDSKLSNLEFNLELEEKRLQRGQWKRNDRRTKVQAAATIASQSWGRKGTAEGQKYRLPPPSPVKVGDDEGSGGSAEGQKYRLPPPSPVKVGDEEGSGGGAAEGQKYRLPDLNVSPPESLSFWFG